MKYCMRGGLIKGKEVVPGNSPKNDIYDVKLGSGKTIKASAGEIVLDKETLAKDPLEWIKFIQKEKAKSPDLFKDHFYDGGMPQPYTNDPSNMLYQQVQDMPAPPAQNIVKPANDRIRQLESVRDNLGGSYWTPKLQQEYSVLKAQGYSQGGLVSDFLEKSPMSLYDQDSSKKMDDDEENQDEEMLDKKQNLLNQKDDVKQKFNEGGNTAAAPNNFDPDKFLADTNHVEFNPDEFLKNTAPEPSMKERLIQGGLNTLPTAGMIAGGILATPETAGLGTVAGATAGGIAGNELKRIGEKYLLGKDQTSGMEHIKEAAKVGAESAAAEAGGQALMAAPGFISAGGKKALQVVGKKLGFNSEFIPKPDIEQISKAGEVLGLDVPNAVKTSNPTFQKIESGLAQSPTIPAKEIREGYENYFKGLDSAGDKIEEMKSPGDSYSTGSQLKNQIQSYIEEKSAPVSELYQDLVKPMQNIKVNQEVVNKQFGALKRDPLFQTTKGQQILNDWKGITNNQPELNSLKETRSQIFDELGGTATPADQSRMQKIYDTMTKIRDNSIESTKLELPKEQHAVVDQLRDQLTLADKSHSSNLKDFNSIKRLVGNTEIGSPSQFSNMNQALKEGDLSSKASNLDTGSMKSLREDSPEIFETVKQAKIDDMVNASTRSIKGFNDADFFKRYGKLDEEMKNMLFSPEQRKHIEALQTLRQATPQKLGPSGTPEGLSYMADIPAQIKNTVSDYAKKKALLPGRSVGSMKEFLKLTPSSLAIKSGLQQNMLDKKDGK